ncbi:nucleotidyl transferase AbiEii/AbiGii toxin family protein [Enterovibrio baiacu]|uniref:nucleotidyl transferase AbiEii/AbiGii toxin family protein n=1 Tax=Enterovibrio baiacu TaxID=2491023 RepID=UPI003D0ADC06
MEYNIEEWVTSATSDRVTFRQAVHTILHAISTSEYLQPIMVMKGGMLLGIRYKSSRFTEDIDFSTIKKISEIDKDEFENELTDALKVSASELSYQVECKIQSFKVQPKNPEAEFPAFQLKIGYASHTDAGAMKRLEKGQCPNTVKIDYSFNEETCAIDQLSLQVDQEDENVLAYSIHDILAEKYRSMIQQKVRDRSRRQDVYDINFLLESCGDISTEEKMEILETLIKKSEGRLEPSLVNINSLDDQEIYNRSKQNYPSLESEVEGDLPDFDSSYNKVNDFYKSLPWGCISL